MDARMVMTRLREAGKTLALMPGIGGYAEREFPSPDPEAITRMDEVLQVWLRLCRSDEDRRAICRFMLDVSVAAKDLRRLGRAITHLAVAVH